MKYLPRSCTEQGWRRDSHTLTLHWECVHWRMPCWCFLGSLHSFLLSESIRFLFYQKLFIRNISILSPHLSFVGENNSLCQMSLSHSLFLLSVSSNSLCMSSSFSLISIVVPAAAAQNSIQLAAFVGLYHREVDTVLNYKSRNFYKSERISFIQAYFQLSRYLGTENPFVKKESDYSTQSYCYFYFYFFLRSTSFSTVNLQQPLFDLSFFKQLSFSQRTRWPRATLCSPIFSSFIQEKIYM